MNYDELFSQVVSRSKASAIRELLKIISRPEIISFAGDYQILIYSHSRKLNKFYSKLLQNMLPNPCNMVRPKDKKL